MEASKFLRIRGLLLFECVGAGNIQQSAVIPGVQILTGLNLIFKGVGTKTAICSFLVCVGGERLPARETVSRDFF